MTYKLTIFSSNEHMHIFLNRLCMCKQEGDGTMVALHHHHHHDHTIMSSYHCGDDTMEDMAAIGFHKLLYFMNYHLFCCCVIFFY